MSTFTDRHGLRFDVATNDASPHVTLRFVLADGGLASRMLSAVMARSVAKALVTAAHKLEVREGFEPERVDNTCEICGCTIIVIAGGPRTACADCVISGKIERDSRGLVRRALDAFIASHPDSTDAVGMSVVRDWIVRRMTEDGE